MTQTDRDNKLILSRATDAVRAAERNYDVKAIGFLNPHARSLIMKNILPPVDVKMTFEGGYADAEKDDACVLSRVSGCGNRRYLVGDKDLRQRTRGLTHRDYLGSLMGLGITREYRRYSCVGERSLCVYKVRDSRLCYE